MTSRIEIRACIRRPFGNLKQARLPLASDWTSALMPKGLVKTLQSICSGSQAR